LVIFELKKKMGEKIPRAWSRVERKETGCPEKVADHLEFGENRRRRESTPI
jgi:hypothetical protein